MLRNIGLLFILALATADKCSKYCICKENFATCNSTNFESFGERIFKLKIISPKVPLIINNQPFNVTGLQDVDSISIEYATILDIDDTAFVGISKLSTFGILNSNIPRINDPLTFSKLNKLRILQISNSSLTKFDSLKSKSLEELDLSRNRLTEIFKTSFEFLPSLTFINLENNNILTVNPTAFANLIYLQDVLLSNNNIKFLDPNIFENNTDLVSLHLSNNPLKKLSLNIVPDLEKLVLKSCQLNIFDESFSNNPLLTYLDLSNNSINVTGLFDKMKDLQFLDLSNNGLTRLHQKTFFHNHKLQKIILDNNHFTDFPKLESFDTFETSYFSCNNCSIAKLGNESFEYFSFVVTLNLAHNKLSGANLTALQNLFNLIEVNLSFNNISVINPSSFIKCSALQTVNLSGNPLKVINPNVFYNNRVIHYLDFSNCGLQQLWQQPVKRNLDTLYELNVANNLLTSVSPRDLEVVPFVRVLGISSNPLHCDKVLRDTMTWLTKHDVSPLSSLTNTHENIVLSNATENLGNTSSWKFLAKDRCLDEFYFDNGNDVKTDIFDKESSKKEDDDSGENDLDDDGYDSDGYLFGNDDASYDPENYFFGNDHADYSAAKELYNSIRFKAENSTKYSFLWPTLVFIFTALSVLVIAANVLLLILRNRPPRRVDLPHVKIPGRHTNNRLKKHSGSVYQPLSEEKTDIFIPNRNENVPTHSIPKSSI